MRGVVLGIGIALVGCSGSATTEDRLPEKSASTSQALSPPPPARVSCNQGAPTTTVTAQYMTGIGYRGSVGTLLSSLWNEWSSTGNRVYYDQYQYTSAIYGRIPGAAGYYYRVSNNPGNPTTYWITIPILDSTTTSPMYYPTYPGASVIHTPLFDQGRIYYGNPQTAFPFWLCDHDGPCTNYDHSYLWSVVNDPSLNAGMAGANVGPGVVYASCVAILDPAGNFLDYSAELEEHDPNGCGSCAQ